MQDVNSTLNVDDYVDGNEIRRLISRTLDAQSLLKQGYGVREVSTMLSLPYGLIADLKKDMGLQPKVITKKERTRKQKRKTQKAARRNSRR